MSKVFVTNYAGHNYDKAKDFGEPVNITVGSVNLRSLDRVKLDIAQAIAESDPEDWLLLSGIQIIAVIASTLWLHKHKKCKMLIWERNETEGRYKTFILTTENIDELFNVISTSVTENNE